MTSASLRPELPRPVPERIERLPIDQRGYPVPWFVVWLDESREAVPPGEGTPDFRIADSNKLQQVYGGADRCWVCGERLGAHKAFLIGPMCAVNRTSAEPPSHRDCAEWSARACPFLARPKARRREVGKPDGLVAPPGIALMRNPGVALVWITRRFTLKRDPDGGVLFDIGEPHEVRWYCEGRDATHAEVLDSIESGLPALREVCDRPSDHKALDVAVERAMPLLPVAA